MIKVGKDSAATGVKHTFKLYPDEELICARLESSGKSYYFDDFRNDVCERLSGVTFIKATPL